MKSKKRKVVQRERRIYHGNYLDVHIFPAYAKAKGRRKKHSPSSDVQKRLNQRYREQKLTYLINVNFTKKDIEIGLGFDDEHLPETYEDVQKAVRNYIRRIKRLRCKLELPEMKYIYVIEKGAKRGRWHIHMIINGDVDRDTLEQLWGNGYAHTYRLEFDADGMKGLAKYKVKEPETDAARIDEKVRRWASSKNLKQPTIPQDRDNFISRKKTKEISEGYYTERDIERLYKGYYVQEIQPFFNSVNCGYYCTIRLYRTDVSNDRRVRNGHHDYTDRE